MLCGDGIKLQGLDFNIWFKNHLKLSYFLLKINWLCIDKIGKDISSTENFQPIEIKKHELICRFIQ